MQALTGIVTVRVLRALFAGLFVVVGVPGGTLRAQSDSLARELEAKVDEYIAAWNTYDGAILAEQYTTDADLIMGAGPLLVGRDAIRRGWEQYFAVQEPGRELSIEVLATKVPAPDVAILTVETTTGTRGAVGVERRPRKARGTWVMTRLDGRWLIASIRGMPTEQDRILRATPSAGDPVSTARRFFTAVYGCSGESLDGLANPEVRMSYPIFEERLGTTVLEGRGAVAAFSAGFCQRWRDPEVTVHEAISERGRVVLVWSFSAVSAANDAESDARTRWGGISVFEMDDRGRVLAEYGEESTPGPGARMQR